MFNVHMEVGEADDHSPNHNTAIAGKSSIVGEVGEIRPDPPEVVGDDETLDLTDADEPVMELATIAMVLIQEQMDVGGVSLGSVFNEDLFQSSQELTSQSIRL